MCLCRQSCDASSVLEDLALENASMTHVLIAVTCMDVAKFMLFVNLVFRWGVTQQACLLAWEEGVV